MMGVLGPFFVCILESYQWALDPVSVPVYQIDKSQLRVCLHHGKWLTRMLLSAHVKPRLPCCHCGQLSPAAEQTRNNPLMHTAKVCLPSGA